MTFRDNLGRGFALLTGIAYGAGMMYLLDPDVGRRRRAMIRDQMTSFRHDARCWLKGQLRHGWNNAQGSVFEIRSRFREPVLSDRQLGQRVLAQLGHVVANPGSLQVLCHNGHVTVRGPVMTGERAQIEHRLGQTRGVRFWSMEVREVEDPSSGPGPRGEAQQKIG